MARVSDWFPDWAATLRDRSGRQDWPDATSEAGLAFWDDFERALVRIGATWPHADEASSAACDVPGLYPNQFRPVVVEAVRKLQARSQAEGRGVGAGSIEEARLASKGCPRCGGSGLAPARAHAAGAFRSAGGAELPAGATFAATCPCPMGEAIQRADADLPAGKRSRIPRAGELPMACLPTPAEEAGDPPTRGEALGWLQDLVRASRADRDGETGRRTQSPHHGHARALPGDAPWPPEVDDPVVQKERAASSPARPANPEIVRIPEDDLMESGF